MINNEYIVTLFYKENGKVNPHLTRQAWLNDHQDIYQYLIHRFEDFDSIMEILYRIKNNIEIRPICQFCGGRLTFKSSQFGFRQFCSVSCSKQFINESLDVGDKAIILNDLITNGQLNNNRLQEKYLKEHGYFNFLKNIYTDALSMAEKVYCLYHNLEAIPTCVECQKHKALFKNFNDGYDLFCSKQCVEKNYFAQLKLTDQNIVDLIYPNEKLNTVMLSPAILKNYHICGYIQKRYKDSESLAESIYRIKNNIESRPTCEICNSLVKFKSITYGFSKYCSKTCYNQLLLTNPNEINEVNDEIVKDIFKDRGKRGNTTIGYVGLNSYLRNRFFDTSNAREALYRIENNLEDAPLCPNCNQPIKFNKWRNTYNYACSNYCTTHLNAIKFYKDNYNLDIDFDDKIVKINNYCELHPEILIGKQTFLRRLHKNENLCPICNPYSVSSLEKAILNILIKNNIQFEQHNRKIIYPYELDFYLIDFKIAIECNGIYWHRDDETIFSSGDFKYGLCSQQNIRLFTFWEDEIIEHLDIVEDIILSVCGLNKSIYARSCVVGQIAKDNANQFLQKNSLNPIFNSDVSIGLFYKNKLYQLLTLNQKNSEFILTNIVSKNNFNVIGGVSKLLTYFKNNYEWQSIIAYVEKDKQTSYLLDQLQFKYIEDSGPLKIFYNGLVKVNEHDQYNLVCKTAGKLKYELQNA